MGREEKTGWLCGRSMRKGVFLGWVSGNAHEKGKEAWSQGQDEAEQLSTGMIPFCSHHGGCSLVLTRTSRGRNICRGGGVALIFLSYTLGPLRPQKPLQI